MTPNPFKDAKIRSIQDPRDGTNWFSVVDLCAVLTGSSHQKARNYWKWFKAKLTSENFQVVSVTNQLKYKSPNGKYYFTEVVDFRTLIYLTQICPNSHANKFKIYLADVLLEKYPIAKVEAALAKAGETYAKQVYKKYKDNKERPYELLTATKEQLWPI